MKIDYLANSIKVIQSFFTHVKVEDYSADDLNEVRTKAFYLESFGRVIKRASKKNKPEKSRVYGELMYVHAKFIEDAIGGFLYVYEMSELMEPSALVNIKLDEAFQKLLGQKEQILKSANTIKAALLSFSKEYDVQKVYLKGLKRELKKLHKKVEEIDPRLLEDGTHELRRTLRWVIMHIVYPKGLFSYTNSPQKISPYLVLSEPGEVSVDYKALAKLSAQVGSLGKVKDQGLLTHYADHLKGKSADINKSFVEAVDLSILIQREVLGDELILKLRKTL